MSTSGHHISAEPSAAEMAAMEALAAGGSSGPDVCTGMNLLKNPGCESAGEPPPDWDEASGDWKRQQGGVDDFPAAHSGTYLFWAGEVATGELYQDVDVSAEATQIDLGNIRIRFSGWLNTFVSDNDTSRVIVEYRKADETVLATYDSGAQNVDTWTNFTDAKIAPAGTRKVRVRLLAVRDIGPDNDGYFDDLSLVAECNVCGATVEFLDNSNDKILISPETKALNVSNYVTNIGLSASSGFDVNSGDRDNFRLEVEDAEEAGGSVTVTLKVGGRSAITYTLNKKFGNKFRGEFLRLVTDSTDDAVQTTQTVLCKLGESVVLSYTRAGQTCKDERTIKIGRPPSESNNGTDQLKHDVRLIAATVVVFSKPGTTKLDGAINDSQTTIKVDSVANAHTSGNFKIQNEVIIYTGTNTTTNEFTGCTRGGHGTTAAAHADNTDVLYSTTTPAVSATGVNNDLTTANERLAQSTIGMSNVYINMGGQGQPGNRLPPAMLDGYARSQSPRTMLTLTADEKAIVLYNDENADSIDIYYVEKIEAIEDPTKTYRGWAYRKGSNNTGDTNYQNFVVIASTRRPFTLPHEFMHILLDSGHRTGANPDPSTALFYAPTSTTNSVGATKRIGPFKDDGPGDNDTFDIRGTAENLP